MTAALLPCPRAKFFVNNTNAPLSGGKIYTYAAGTSTPLATYSDAAGTIPNTNPVTLDANGEAAIYLGSGLSYKINVLDASNVQVPGYPVDSITSADFGSVQLRADLANTSNTALGANLVGRAVQGRIVTNYGAISGASQSVNNAAFQAAINASPNNTDVAIYVPEGTYDVNCAGLTYGTRRLTWILDANATVGGDLIQSRADSTLLPGMTIWSGRVWRSAQATSTVPTQIVKTANPLNFFGTEAAFVVQHGDSVNLASGNSHDSEIHAFACDGDGAVTSLGGDGWVTNTFYRGARFQMDKSKGGTGHCITINGNLGAIGAIGAYNELGGYQGFLRNTGSTNGYISGVEMRVSDSENSAGLNARDTRMIGMVSGVEKYKVGATRISFCFYAESSGSQDVQAAYKAVGPLLDGVNLKDSTISRWNLSLKNNGRIGWNRTSDNDEQIGNCNRIGQEANKLLIRMGGTDTSYGFQILDGVGNQFFDVNPVGGLSTLYSLNVTLAGGFRVATSTPASSSAAGTAGTICWDSSFLYVCTATNTWKRVAIATW